MKKQFVLFLLLASSKTLCMSSGAVVGGALGLFVTAGKIVKYNHDVEESNKRVDDLEKERLFLIRQSHRNIEGLSRKNPIPNSTLVGCSVFGTIIGAVTGTVIELGINDVKRNGIKEIMPPVIMVGFLAAYALEEKII